MKNILRITALFLVTSLAWAQQTTGKISGQVTDNTGAGLAGANVIVDGTSMGAATDNDGKIYYPECICRKIFSNRILYWI